MGAVVYGYAADGDGRDGETPYGLDKPIRCDICNKWVESEFISEFKGDDIHLSVDMLSLAYENAYDTAIVISGDGDFEPLIKKVKKLGKRVENAYFSSSRSDALKSICDSSIRLDDLILSCIKR